MKRKILSVLGLFMSVLISTAVLASCEKTPAGDNGGSDIEEKSGVSDENKSLLMSGDYVELDVHERITHIAIDTNGAIICCTEDGKVYVLDGQDGKQLYTFQTENIQRLEKNDDCEGFDYRIMTASAVLYRNSSDPNAKLNLILPECVAKCEETRPYDAHFYYDVLGDKIVYAADDGIYICNSDGSKNHLLVSNDDLPTNREYFAEMVDNTDLEPGVANSPLTYVCPKFVCGGKKVAVKVFFPMDGMCAGFAVFDSETEEKIFLKKSLMDSDYQYPVLEDCVAYKVHLTAEIYSMETGEKVDEIKAEKFFRTADYNKLVCYAYDPTVVNDDNYKGLEIYAFSSDDSGKLINKVNLEADAYICAVTKNYILVYIEYSAKVYLCAIEME